MSHGASWLLDMNKDKLKKDPRVSRPCEAVTVTRSALNSECRDRRSRTSPHAALPCSRPRRASREGPAMARAVHGLLCRQMPVEVAGNGSTGIGRSFNKVDSPHSHVEASFDPASLQLSPAFRVTSLQGFPFSCRPPRSLTQAPIHTLDCQSSASNGKSTRGQRHSNNE